MNDTLDQRPQHWLITGGCGFIGTSLVHALVGWGDVSARILDNLSVGTREDLGRVCTFRESDPAGLSTRNPASIEPSTVELMPGDIRNPQDCLAAAKGVDVIVHLAANTGVAPSVEDPCGDMKANVAGTLNMLEAARHQGVRRFVFASSGAPVGEVEPPIHENLAPHPVSPYGASKLAGEGYCSAYFRTFGIETIALRFGNVYGPGSSHKSSLVAKFIRQAFEGETCEVYGDGNQTRDFVFIQDLVDALIKAARLAPPPNALPWGLPFQIATSREHTVNEVAERLKQRLKSHGVSMKIVHGEPRLGDVRRNFSDTTRARKVLGWRATTDLAAGLDATIDWFTSRGRPSQPH